MTSDIATALADYIVTSILNDPRRVIKPDTPLISSGLIDSLSIVDLAFFVEEQFGVKLKTTELNAETFDTLAGLESLILARQKTGERGK